MLCGCPLQVSTIAQYVLERMRRVQDSGGALAQVATLPAGATSATAAPSNAAEGAAMQVTDAAGSAGQEADTVMSEQQLEDDSAKAAQLLSELLALADAADSQAGMATIASATSQDPTGSCSHAAVRYPYTAGTSAAAYNNTSSSTRVPFVGTTVRRVRQYYKDADPLGLQV